MPGYMKLRESYRKYLEGRYSSTGARENLEDTMPV